MSAPEHPWVKSDAELYIRELFSNVLHIDEPSKEQVAAWTDRAMLSGDPVAIFRAIIASRAHQEYMAASKDGATRWPPGHFYSPAISRKEVAADSKRVFGHRSLMGIDLQDEAQLSLFGRLAPFFESIPFTDHRTAPFRYHYRNPSYGYGDAIIYWSMLNLLKPGRIIEIGSGFSSALALDTIDILGLPTVCAFVDPFPEVATAVTAPLRSPHRIIPDRVQSLDPSILEDLDSGDLLFIDSSHVLKTGSDVHFELTEMLPRLPSGAMVHFHDVFINFEYPARWVLERNHGWNEQYGIHAFLMFNGAFKVEFMNDYFAKTYSNVIQQIAPEQCARILLNPGGGLWLRRT